MKNTPKLFSYSSSGVQCSFWYDFNDNAGYKRKFGRDLGSAAIVE